MFHIYNVFRPHYMKDSCEKTEVLNCEAMLNYTLKAITQFMYTNFLLYITYVCSYHDHNRWGQEAERRK